MTKTEKTPSDLSVRLAAMEALIPEEGYNVVAVDTFEEPGDDLYLVGHYNTREEAEKVKEVHLKNCPMEPCYVYSPDDEVAEGVEEDASYTPDPELLALIVAGDRARNKE